VTVDEVLGGFDGGVVINAIHLNSSDELAVSPNDICAIDRHFRIQSRNPKAFDHRSAPLVGEGETNTMPSRKGRLGRPRGLSVGRETDAAMYFESWSRLRFPRQQPALYHLVRWTAAARKLVALHCRRGKAGGVFIV
jgi:hypothetical protein